MRAALDDVAIIMQADLEALDLGEVVREYRFHPRRRWRFDFAIRTACYGLGLAVEIEGGIWGKGRHTRGLGYQNDMLKYNQAVILGWHLLRFSPEDVRTGVARTTLRQWKEANG